MNLICLLLALAVAVPGKEKPQDKNATLRATIKEINAAAGKADLKRAEAAFAKAEAIRGDFQDQKLTGLAAAIGKAATSKNSDLALAAVNTLGKLKIRGSSKSLGKLLAPPAKPKEAKLVLHKAAIAAAASIHDVATLKTLEKLVTHASPEIGVAAAGSFAGYAALDPKPKLALAKRLVKILAKLEKQVKAKKEPIAREPFEKVHAALLVGLSKLTGEEGLSTSAEWTKHFKDAAKEARKK